MKPYVLLRLPEDEVRLLDSIRCSVDILPDMDLGNDEKGEKIVLSCHILARALGKVFGLKYIDGFLYPNFMHSWLVTTGGNIIDVYPIAVYGGPFLMDGSACSPASRLYKKKSILAGRTKSPSFRRAVRLVTKSIRISLGK